MRPIDADALKEDHGMADDCPLCKQKVISCQYDTIYTKMDFCGWIDDAPTIKPERKTGKWIPMFNGAFKGGAYWFECSECKRIVPEVRNGGWGYCPNCGADMREEGEQE